MARRWAFVAFELSPAEFAEQFSHRLDEQLHRKSHFEELIQFLGGPLLEDG